MIDQTYANLPYRIDETEVMHQIEAYEKIGKIAEEAGLIFYAYAGVIVLMHPSEQLRENEYCRIQVATGNRNRIELDQGECEVCGRKLGLHEIYQGNRYCQEHWRSNGQPICEEQL